MYRSAVPAGTYLTIPNSLSWHISFVRDNVKLWRRGAYKSRGNTDCDTGIT